MVQPETKAIIANKWLNRLLRHLRTWPGTVQPWSDECLPEWCIKGFELVLAFQSEANAAELQKSRIRDYSHPMQYPWDGKISCPFWASSNIRNNINVVINVWVTRPQLTKKQYRDKVNEAIEMVEMGIAEEVWVDDTLSKALRNDSDLTDTRAHDALGEALMGLTEPEIRRRLGPNPSQSDWQRVASQVMAEMAESGEFEKLLGTMGVRPSGYQDGA